MASFLKDPSQLSCGFCLKPYYRDHLQNELREVGLSGVVSLSEALYSGGVKPTTKTAALRAPAQAVTATKEIPGAKASWH